jgi:hypothetical protein
MCRFSLYLLALLLLVPTPFFRNKLIFVSAGKAVSRTAFQATVPATFQIVLSGRPVGGVL